MKITVTFGCVFLKEQGHDEVHVTWRFLLCESLCTLMGKLEMWMAHGGKTAQKDSCETRAQVGGDGRGQAKGPDAMSLERTIGGGLEVSAFGD